MVTNNSPQPTLDDVLRRLAAADHRAFYQQAEAFEQAASMLEEVKDLLRKHHRTLEEAWSNGNPERHAWIADVVRHVDGLLTSVRGSDYPRLLRRLGDMVVDSRQRLTALQHESPSGDRDARARKILDDLSTSYRQVGGSLAQLPERTAKGGVLPATMSWTAAGKERFSHADGSHRGALDNVAAETVAPMPETAVPFGRFSPLNSRPAAAAAKAADPAETFGGFAGLAVRDGVEAPTAVGISGAKGATKEPVDGREDRKKAVLATVEKVDAAPAGTGRVEATPTPAVRDAVVSTISLSSQPTPAATPPQPATVSIGHVTSPIEVPPPTVGTPAMPGLMSPVASASPMPAAPREASVWLRADAGGWTHGCAVSPRPDHGERDDKTWGGLACPPDDWKERG